MSARDELQTTIYQSNRLNTQVDLQDDRRLQGSHLAWAGYAAAAVRAAGYRKLRTIPDAHLCSDSDGSYPVDHKAGTIVQSADGSVWRFDEGYWDNLDWGSASLRGPATVLFEPVTS